MQIEQILVEAGETRGSVRYRDAGGRPGQLVVEGLRAAAVAALFADAAAVLPASEEVPDKEQIEAEITRLEVRLTQLKASINET